jgi:hypothetical protein
MKSVKNCKHPTIICTAQNFDTKKCFARKNCMKMKLRRLRLVIFVIHSDYFSFHQKMEKNCPIKKFFRVFLFLLFFCCMFFANCWKANQESFFSHSKQQNREADFIFKKILQENNRSRFRKLCYFFTPINWNEILKKISGSEIIFFILHFHICQVKFNNHLMNEKFS